MTTTAAATTVLDLRPGTYTIDPAHSQVGFVTRHAMVTKVRGAFTDVDGTAVITTGLQDAQISVSIPVAGIDTRNAERDAHLRGADFFDAEHHPTITFVSTAVSAVDPHTLHVAGDLTIKGHTHPVEIDFTYAGTALDVFGNERVGFEGSTVIERKDFGLTWNAVLETGGVLVSDKVTLELEISAIRQA